MKILLLFLFAFGIRSVGARAGQLPDDLVEKLSATIRERCPDVQIEVSNKVFTAKHGTMLFTLHNRSKTGEVYPQPHQQEGPNFKGFVLTVSLQEGRYQGAAVIPQTIQGPYYPTFIDAAGTEDGKGYYWVTFSYGSRLDEKVRSAILDVIPRTKFQRDGAANGIQPVRSETNRNSAAVGSRR